MNDEIKQIIKDIKLTLDVTVKDMVLLNRKDIKQLLDYITNLQLEKNDYKSRNKKAIEYLGIDEDILKTCEMYDVNGIEVYKILQGVDKE